MYRGLTSAYLLDVAMMMNVSNVPYAATPASSVTTAVCPKV